MPWKKNVLFNTFRLPALIAEIIRLCRVNADSARRGIELRDCFCLLFLSAFFRSVNVSIHSVGFASGGLDVIPFFAKTRLSRFYLSSNFQRVNLPGEMDHSVLRFSSPSIQTVTPLLPLPFCRDDAHSRRQADVDRYR